MAYKRRKMSRKKSRKNFTTHASKTHRRNTQFPVQRGGIAL